MSDRREEGGVIVEEGGFGEGLTFEESDKALGASASTRTSRLLRFALIQG